MLGSTRVITDQTGSVVSRRDFMPFGEDIQRANYGSDNLRQKFTGYQKDKETGLDFAEARYYNDNYGRFTAVDPLLASGKSANPQTFNRYSYSLNDPLNVIDTDGNIPVYVKGKPGNRHFTTDIKEVRANFRGFKQFTDSPTEVWGRYNGSKKDAWYVVTADGIYSKAAFYAKKQAAAEPAYVNISLIKALASESLTKRNIMFVAAGTGAGIGACIALCGPGSVTAATSVILGTPTTGCGTGSGNGGGLSSPCGGGVQKIGNRFPVNSKYAGEVYPLEKLTPELREKYPESVRFTNDGFPDFSPYAAKTVNFEFRGDHYYDFKDANELAGFAHTPEGFTWHHHQDGETMQLVPQDIHDAVRHTGGASIKRHQ